MNKFKGIWIPYEVLVNKILNDKEKLVYSMILYLSKERECIITNSYIAELLHISKVQASRIINSLKKKLYINVEIVYKENSKEIALRKIIPIYRNVNTYEENSAKPINKNVKDIIRNKKIYYNRNWSQEDERDYSNFDWSKLYANNIKKTWHTLISELTSHSNRRWVFYEWARWKYFRNNISS